MDNKKSKLTILAEIAGILSLAVAIAVGINQWKPDETTTATDNVIDKLQPNQEKNKTEKIDTPAQPIPTRRQSYIEGELAPKTTTKGGTSLSGVGSGRWEVRAGTFSNMEGVRSRLEEVIRMGYINAEIKKTKYGNSAVIVFRSNSRAKAEEVVDQLVRRGIDAVVAER